MIGCLGMRWRSLLTLLVGLVAWRTGAEVLRLDGGNFELGVQTYVYLAILFYDSTPLSKELIRKWEEAAELVKAAGSDIGMGMIDATQPDVDELVASYGFTTPAIRIFRRRIMFEFELHPSDTAETIAKAMVEEGMPVVQVASSAAELETIIEAVEVDGTFVLGFFNKSDIEEGDRDGSGPYATFQSAADQLRGYATFVNGGFSLMMDYGVKNRPAVVYVNENERRYYTGEWADVTLADWVMAQDVPLFGRLARTVADGAETEDYATKFFGSTLIKFIAFVKEDMADARQLQGLAKVAANYRGQALFAYCVEGSFSEAWSYLQVDSSRLPALYFYDPQTEQRVASPSLAPLDEDEVGRFVSAILLGTYLPQPKSEKPPVKQTGPVMKLVSSTFIDAVSVEDKDVLVLLTKPFCPACLDVGTAFELLGKAFQSEPRVILAKIDTQLNDLPPNLIKSERMPALLLFPASRKPYPDGLAPHVVTDPSPNLHDLVHLLYREGSFGKELRIATQEQLGALAVDEEIVRASLEEEQRVNLRNQARKVYGNPAVDYLLGDVVFDGHRWHWVATGASLLANVVLLLLVMLLQQYVAQGRGEVNHEREKSE